MVSVHGIFFKESSLFWKNLRTFAFEHRSVFEIGFMFLYTSEQAILVGLTYISNNLQELSLIVSMFSLIVLSTFELNKRVMESRIKILESELNKILYERYALQLKTKNLEKEYISLSNSIQKSNKNI